MRNGSCVRFGLFLLPLLVLTLPALAQPGQQQFANLGDFKLVSGETIRDCKIGYRTYGELNAAKSNAILFTTWFGGNTEQLAGNFGPGKIVDSSKYYVIAIDAIGDGVSSSPSNSKLQPHMKFPKFTVRDMVESQHHVLTGVLHIRHLKAVMGVSMGGMQTFQWMVSYPDFMDRAVPIVGSPRLAPYDMLHWQAENDAILHDPGWKNGEYTSNPARPALAQIAAMILSTPPYFNEKHTREQAVAIGQKAAAETTMDANDHIRTGEAVMVLDVSDAFEGSMDKAAAAVHAKTLVVVSRQDHTVTAGPALDFAKKIHAEVLELNAPCGHLLMECQGEHVIRAVGAFLER
jgi:homoserine O-acetyltransferase